MFDKQQHVEKLIKIECIIVDISMLCDGLNGASSQMDDKHYINTVAGAIGLMAKALDETLAILSEAEYEYRSSLRNG